MHGDAIDIDENAICSKEKKSFCCNCCICRYVQIYALLDIKTTWPENDFISYFC